MKIDKTPQKKESSIVDAYTSSPWIHEHSFYSRTDRITRFDLQLSMSLHGTVITSGLSFQKSQDSALEIL